MRRAEGLDSADAIVAESLCEFLADRMQFLEQFPEAICEQIINELAPKLPESRAVAYRQAALAAQPKADRYRRTDGAEPIAYRAHSNSVIDISATADLSIAASASHDGTVGIWDLKQARCTARFDAEAKHVYLSPDGTELWTCSGRNLSRWDATTSQHLQTLDVELDSDAGLDYSPVVDVSFADRLGAAVSSRMLTVFSLDENCAVQEIPPLERQYWGQLCLSGDGSRLFAASIPRGGESRSRIVIIDPATGDLRGEIVADSAKKPARIATNWDGSLVVVGHRDGRCTIAAAPNSECGC
jgi:hypothetical protein